MTSCHPCLWKSLGGFLSLPKVCLPKLKQIDFDYQHIPGCGIFGMNIHPLVVLPQALYLALLAQATFSCLRSVKGNMTTRSTLWNIIHVSPNTHLIIHPTYVLLGEGRQIYGAHTLYISLPWWVTLAFLVRERALQERSHN